MAETAMPLFPCRIEFGTEAIVGLNDKKKSGVRSGTGVPPVDLPATDVTDGTLRIRRGAYLPHWTQQGCTYTVTFRLCDSLPRQVLESWLFERENIVKTARQLGRPLSDAEEARLDELHSEKVESYLDAGHGKCWMKDGRVAKTVVDSVKHFADDRYDLMAWCVMPNHVHVVVMPWSGYELDNILHSWKSFSAHSANKILGRKGQFWQEEYYDHLVRNEDELRHSVEYALDNPQKAGLKEWKWRGSKSGAGSGTGVPPV